MNNTKDYQASLNRESIRHGRPKDELREPKRI
jgi:hypothetical protein